MAAKRTYASIQAQIRKLSKEAEALRAQEIKGVIQRIKVAIDHYGLTAEDLGFATNGSMRAAPAPKALKKTVAAKKNRPSVIRFKDGNGNEWSGFGPKPRWLREAIDGGAPLESFAVTPTH